MYNLYYGKLAANITNKALHLARYTSQCRARQTDSDILKDDKIALQVGNAAENALLAIRP